MTSDRPAHVPDDWLGRLLSVEIDRPLGSLHPRHPEMIYPENYGFLPGTMAADGHGIDVYLLGVDTPVDRLTGRCIAILHREDDEEDKLVVSPDGMTFSDRQILARVDFQERFFATRLIR